MGKIIHGMTRSGTRKENRQNHFYSKWLKMRYRCNNPKNKDYKDYGGRGIRVERNTFIEFYNDMYGEYLLHVNEHGKRNTTIDIIDVNGNYCKSNCRFLDCKGQANNKRKSIANNL